MNSGYEDEKDSRYLGRVTKFSKQQNEQKISDLNLIKNGK